MWMHWDPPSSTARDERRPAIELENACKESYANVSPRINSPTKRSSDIDLVSNGQYAETVSTCSNTGRRWPCASIPWGNKRTPGSLQSRFAGIQQAGKHRAAVANSFLCVQEARRGLLLASPLLHESPTAVTHNDVHSASSRPLL